MTLRELARKITTILNKAAVWANTEHQCVQIKTFIVLRRISQTNFVKGAPIESFNGETAPRLEERELNFDSFK